MTDDGIAQEGGTIMLQGICVSVLGRREEEGKKKPNPNRGKLHVPTVLPRTRAAHDSTAVSAR